MNALCLEPHQDDTVLFNAFRCIEHKPLVVTVLASQLQEDRGTGITNGEREFENKKALAVLGCENEQWTETDAAPDWDATERKLRTLEAEIVFAPAVEEGGHDQHNAVGELALSVFGDRVQPYYTYVRGAGKTTGREITPEWEWIVLKLKALACFGSQIREPTTRPWFLGDLREWQP